MHFIRPRLYCLPLLLFASIFSFPIAALAQESSLQIEPEQSASTPRIESDTERNAFIFIIDGEEFAILDKTGLYIPGSITFGGTMTDAGREWVDDYITRSANGNFDDTSEGGGNEE